MQINLTNELNADTFVGAIVLSCMSNSLSCQVVKEIADEGRVDAAVILDVVLTVNGREVDLKVFADHWQSQVERMIEDQAVELIAARIGDLVDNLSDVETLLKDRFAEASGQQQAREVFRKVRVGNADLEFHDNSGRELHKFAEARQKGRSSTKL